MLLPFSVYVASAALADTMSPALFLVIPPNTFATLKGVPKAGLKQNIELVINVSELQCY